MARDIETLLVKLEARITDFEKKMAQAERRASTASSRIGSTFAGLNTRVGGLMRLLGVSLGVVAIERFITRTVAAGAEISDLSKKLGISAEEFQRLSFAVTQTGGSQEAFVTGFRGMANFLTQASRGSKEATGTLKLLGLSFDDIKKKSPTAVFEILLDRAGKIQNPLQRAAVLAQLFSRQGAALGALSLVGAAGIEKLKESAVGVIPNKTVEDLDKTADKFDALGRSATAAAAAILEPLLPAINELTGSLSKPEFQNALKVTAERLAQIVGFLTDHPEVIGILGGAAVGGKVGGLPGAVVGGIGGAVVSAPPGQFRPPFMGPSEDVGALQRSRDQFELNKALGVTSTVAPKAAAGVADVAAASTAAAAGAVAVTDANKGVAGSIETLLRDFPDLVDDFSEFSQAEETAAEKAAKVAADLAFQGEQLRRTARDQAAFNAVQQAGVDISTQIGSAIAAQARANFDLSRSIEESARQWDGFRDAGRDALQTVVEGIRTNQSEAEILGNLLAQLAQRVATAGIDRLLEAALGASGTGAGGFLGQLVQSLFAGTRQMGGPVQPGRLYQVHDQEWFIPRVGGRIEPAGQRGGSGGTQVVRHVVELVMTPEVDARIRRVAGPQSQDISFRTVQRAGKTQRREQELSQ